MPISPPSSELPPLPTPEAGLEKQGKPPEHTAEKPGDGELKMASELKADLDPNKTKADVIMSKLEHFGFGDLVGAFKHKTEAAPAAPVSKAVEATPAQPVAKAPEIGDADFDAIKDFAKPTAEQPVPVPPPPVEQAMPPKAAEQKPVDDQGPLDHTNETNTFILDEERRRSLGIPWSQWQEYKKNEVAQAQQKAEADRVAAQHKIEQDARNARAQEMMKATKDNVDAAGVKRTTEANAAFTGANEPNNLSAEDNEKRRSLGMSAQEYTNYKAAVQKEQQNRSDTAAREQQEKQAQAQRAAEQPPQRAEVAFQPRTTGDAETDALGQDIIRMQQQLQQLRAGGGTNANTIASSEANLQVQIDASIKRWKKMENDAYWKKKNEQPMDNFRNFKLKDVGEGLKGQAESTVNSADLDRQARVAREAMNGKSEEEQKKIFDALDPKVKRAMEIDNQQAELRKQRQQREEQAKQDAANPDEARQRQRQEIMADWVKQNPEPTDSPLEHSTWMNKLAAKTAELDAADLDEARRRQEIKARTEAAEPENIQAVRDGTTAPETLTGEAALVAEIAELKAQLKEKEDQEAEAMKLITDNPELVDKLPEPLKSQVKEKKPYNRFAVFATLLGVTVFGLAKTAGGVATGEMARGGVR